MRDSINGDSGHSLKESTTELKDDVKALKDSTKEVKDGNEGLKRGYDRIEARRTYMDIAVTMLLLERCRTKKERVGE